MPITRFSTKYSGMKLLLHEPGVALRIEEITEKINRRVVELGSETKTDFTMGRERPRGAVIAGYGYHNSTAERSREVLLSSLDHVE